MNTERTQAPATCSRQRRALPGLRRARRGMSLVEVLVVVVILVLGMLAIGRLFPEGFASLNFSEHATAAQRLMYLREEEARKNSDGLPDAIGALDPNTGLILSGLTPNDMHTALRQLSIPGLPGAQPDDPRFSDVNIYRRVFGEQFLIPPPQSTPLDPNGQTTSLYRALFSPIYSDVAMAPAAAGVTAYSGTSLQRTVMQDPPQSDNFRNLARAGHFGYGVDYENGFLFLIAVEGYGRLFKVEFSYHNGPDVLGQSYPDNQVYFPAAAAGQDPVVVAGELTRIHVQRFNMRTAQIDQIYDHDLQTGQTTVLPGSGAITFPPGAVYQGYPNTASLDVGSDFLYRRFTQLAVSDVFTADPFEFKVYDPILGLIGFNPIAATFALPNQRGKGLTAKIDYDVDDWHILHYDASLSPTPVDPDGIADNGDEYYAVKLPTGNIKEIGETEETVNFIVGQPPNVNSLQYQGLVRYYPDTATRTGTPGLAVIVVDMATGYQIDSRTLQKPGPVAPPGLDNSNGEIDYRNGVVKLWKYASRTGGGAPVNWSPPFAYQGGAVGMRGFDPAGRAVRVYYRTSNDFAVASFKPFTRYTRQGTLANLAHREFFDGYGGGYVLFPNVDAEKTMAVDYTWLSQSTGQLRTELGELHQVQPPGTAGGPSAGGSGNRWWLRLAHSTQDSTGGRVAPDGNFDADVTPGSVMIRGIRGASFHTRVVWMEGRRMRHRERATILTRGSTR